jgi:hypothetical protein
MRSKLVASLAFLAVLSLADGVRALADPAKAVKIIFMSSRVWKQDGQQNGITRLVQGTYTEDGSREETVDGSILLRNNRKGVQYTLNPQSMRGEQFDFAPSSKNRRDAAALGAQMRSSLGAAGATIPKPEVRNETLRGYPCRVTIIDSTVSDVRVRTENWVMTFAGQDVSLRHFTQYWKAGSLDEMYVTEAAEIEELTDAPRDLLKVPDGYNIKRVDLESIRKALSDLKAAKP